MSPRLNGIIQLLLIVAFIASGLLIASSLKSSRSPAIKNQAVASQPLVNTLTTTLSDFPITINTTGVIEAQTVINLVPQISGRVQSVSTQLSAGGVFSSNETLFTIDKKQYQLTVNALTAEVAKARTALALERARSDLALKDWQDINPNQAIPSLVARKPQLQDAKATLASASAQLESAKLDLSRSVFSLPFNGRVMNNNIGQGQFVTAGQTYGQVFAVDNLQIKASVDDSKLQWLNTRDDLHIAIAVEHQGKIQTLEGKLLQNPAVLEQTTRFATLYLGFTKPPKELLPGVFTNINITGRTLEQVTILPSSALQSDRSLWLVTADNTVKKHLPSIVYQTDNSIVVDNLNAQSHIIINRLSNISEGMVVQTQQKKGLTSNE